jgi:hypothetical protein
MAQEAEVRGLFRIVPAWAETLLKPYKDILETQSAPQPSGSEALLGDGFVSDLGNTCVARFDGSVKRVGTFVTLPSDEHTETVSIDWLCEFNVPVWYPWGPREIELARKNPFFQRYAPPPDAVYVVLPRQTPALSKPILTKDKIKHFSRQTEPEPAERTWEAWFKKQAKAEPKLKEQETAVERQRRENREQCPPTTTARTHFFV